MRSRPASATLGVVLVATMAGGCSGAGRSGAVPETTVTVTQTSAPTASTPGPVVDLSDVAGRRYDLGQVQSVRTVQGRLVVELDRWTPLGSTDSRLARYGLPLRPHDDQLYVNQNAAKTYTAPVAPQAQVVVNTCVRVGGGRFGMISRPHLAVGWLGHHADHAVLLVTYDARGQITRMDTDPRC